MAALLDGIIPVIVDEIEASVLVECSETVARARVALPHVDVPAVAKEV
jgi:hypothetical protein